MIMRMSVTVAPMMMMAAPPAVGAGFRLELRIFFDHRRAQALEHFLQYGVLVDAQKTFFHLGLRMTITDMK